MKREFDLDHCWQSWFATKDPVARDRLIVHYSPLVKFVAGRLAELFEHKRQQHVARRGRSFPPARLRVPAGFPEYSGVGHRDIGRGATLTTHSGAPP